MTARGEGSQHVPARITESDRNEVATSEHEELTTQEDVIQRALATTVAEVGPALKRIRARRLYRAAGYHTFEDYCADRWGFSASRARQYIGFATVIENVRSVTTVTPTNEAQARLLTGLQPAEQRKAWRQAVERAAAEDSPVVARHVEEVIRDQKVRAARAALPFEDTDHGAGRQAVDEIIGRGLIEAGDLHGIPAEARISLVWEIMRADEELSIEWREQHPDLLPADEEGSCRYSRPILRRHAREAADRLRAGTIDVEEVRGLLRVDDQLEIQSHGEACQAFEDSLSSFLQRVRQGYWHDPEALATLRRQHDSISKALSAFLVAAVKMETVLATANALRGAKHRKQLSGDGAGDSGAPSTQ